MEQNQNLVEKIQAGIANFKEKSVELKDTYYKPTPKIWRKIGDSILILGSAITTVSALIHLSPYIIVGATVLTALGKIITNFAK